MAAGIDSVVGIGSGSWSVAGISSGSVVGCGSGSVVGIGLVQMIEDIMMEGVDGRAAAELLRHPPARRQYNALILCCVMLEVITRKCR